MRFVSQTYHHYSDLFPGVLKRILEQELTRRCMKMIVIEQIKVCELVKERRYIFKEKKRDEKNRIQNFAAISLQRFWKSRKQVSKTHFRVKQKKIF